MENKIKNHLKKHDLVLYKALEVFEDLSFIVRKKPATDKYFEILVESIVSQQLSVKAGDTIFGRLKKLFVGEKILPKKVLKIADDKLRLVGLSNAKVKYIKDLASKVESGEVKLDKLNDLSDEQVILALTKVKGIGPWTAEMFLMFSLGRDDIFSHGDLGLKNAIKKIYKLENPSRSEIEDIVKKWSPYKTYISRILWRYLDM